MSGSASTCTSDGPGRINSVGGSSGAVSINKFTPGQQLNQNQSQHVPAMAANNNDGNMSSMPSSSSATNAGAPYTNANANAIAGSSDGADTNVNSSSTQQPRQQQQQQPSLSHLQVGRMVNVLPRTWPGINKQGGTGRITAVHRSSAGADNNDGGGGGAAAHATHVDVRYVVVGGRERRVPVEYVVAAPEYEQEYEHEQEYEYKEKVDGIGNTTSSGSGASAQPTTGLASSSPGGLDSAAATSSSGSAAPSASASDGRPTNATNASVGGAGTARRRRHALRDRSMLLGRCGRCGSLRSDCGSCDWVALEMEQQRQQQQQEEETERMDAAKKKTSGDQHKKNKRRVGKKYRKRNTCAGRGGDHNGSSASPSLASSDSDFSFDDETSLSEIRARRERIYAKLLRETGWDDSNNKKNNRTSRDRGGHHRRRHRRVETDKSDSEKIKVGGDTAKPKLPKRRRIIADDEDSSSSSSSNGDENIQDASKLGRKHSASDGQSSSSDESSSSSSSSDDMNDPILARLAQLRSVRNRGRGRGESAGAKSSSGKAARKRFRNRYTANGRPTTKSIKNAKKSSLETLPPPAARSTSAAISTLSLEAADLTLTDVVDVTAGAGAESPVVTELPQQSQESSGRTGCVDDDNNIGEVEMTQGDFVLSGDENDDDNDKPVAMDIDGGDQDENEEEYFDRDNNYDCARAAAIEDDDPLRLDSTFIQPEGRQAAQSLPEDTVDRTKGIEYLSLPNFFDNTADMIENETLPDARIQVEELGVAIRKAARPNADPGDGNKSPAELENDALLLFNDLRRTLIRDGTDQCRAALRRLTDGKERKRAKSKAKSKGSSSSEYRRFKSLSRSMDLRELRMDAVDDCVEEVLRKCHGLLDGFITKHTGVGSPKRPAENLEGASDSSDDEEGGDSISPRHIPVDEDTNADLGDAADLGAFDPHLHATSRKKKKKSGPGQRKNSTDESRTKRKRSQTKGGNLADRDTSADEFRWTSRQAKGAKKRRTKNAPRTANSGNTAPTNGEVDDDDTFINNDISDEETILIDSRPFDRDLESRPPRRSHHRVSSNSTASNGELRVSFLDDYGGFDSRRATREAEPTKSASERMQEFLDKNSSDAPMLDTIASSSQPRGEGPKRRQRAGTPSEGLDESSNQNKQNGRDRSGKNGNEIIPIPSEALSPEVLFSSLAERQPSASSAVHRSAQTARENIPPAPSNRQTPANSSDLYEKLKSAYKSSPRNAVSLLTRLEVHHIGVQGDGISRVLDSLLSLVQEEGATTLLDVIVNGPSEQAKILHMKLLITVVNFISAQSTLAQENSSSSKLCGIVSQQKFVEEILLQTVDVLYAYFTPDAWANCIRGKISSSSLGVLRELVVSIGKIVPLVETVSRILVCRQQVQMWYRSSLSLTEGEGVFVSSVDPSQYKSFLKTGERAKIGKSNEDGYPPPGFFICSLLPSFSHTCSPAYLLPLLFPPLRRTK